MQHLVLRILRKHILKPSVRNYDQKAFFRQFIEIGHLEAPKPHCTYETGQLFMHRIFGYRGIILFPWVVRVFNHDFETEADSEPAFVAGKDVNLTTKNYYQVFIDSRDRPFIRAQTEKITFLGRLSNYYRTLYSVPGLDYVAHEDILPYTPTEVSPIKHEMLDKFFVHRPEKEPRFEAKKMLNVWQTSNSGWLKISDVHRETTESVRVVVYPFYMGCRKSITNTVYSWKYCIRLQNLSDMAVYMKRQTWKVFSPLGITETVTGDGILGREILLNKYSPAFQYSNHISLFSPKVNIKGSFTVDREDGTSFECKVPVFPLESKAVGIDDSSV